MRRWPAARRAVRNAEARSSLNCDASSPSPDNHTPTRPKSLSMFRTVPGA
jgi:hypothetical protein